MVNYYVVVDIATEQGYRVLALSTTFLACFSFLFFLLDRQFNPVETTQHLRKEKRARRPNESTVKQK